MKYKVNQIVFVDNIKCEIVDIVEEDNMIYYEVMPIEIFCNISRFVTIEKLK